MVDFAHRLETLLPPERIADFARRWRIIELSVFGSVLRDDFGPESDVDVLVAFDAEAPWSLWDFTKMEDELAAIVGRGVDLVAREGLRNPLRRQHIVSQARAIYVRSER